ncbi:TPA: hypothetical protein DCW54_02000 [Candidatus Dependentiae bacterium]|nr:hypothetical protein [Candidatus Dependentiae bacterium]
MNTGGHRYTRRGVSIWRRILWIVFGLAVLVGISWGVRVVFRHFFSTSDNASFLLTNVVNKKGVVPVLVVGSGPAGLAAALYAARGGMHTVVVEGGLPGGQLMGTSWVENWPGMKKMLGPDLMRNAREQAQEFGVLFVQDSVASVSIDQWPYVVTLANGTVLHALSLVVATGSDPRRLGISGETEYWGKGVSVCATCDAPFFKGADIAVIGGGDSALEEAIQLSSYADHVYLVVRGDKMRASQAMQERIKAYPQIEVLLNTKPKEIVGNSAQVTGLVVETNGVVKQLTLQGVFLAIGHHPNSGFIKPVVTCDAEGNIVLAGNTQRTSVPGIFAAGDVADKRYRQAGVAAGAGIRAGLDALEFLTSIGVQRSFVEKIEQRFFVPEGGAQRKVLVEIASVKEFDQLLQQKRFVCVDFFSDMCPACVQLLPVLELAAFARSNVAFVKVNAFKQGELKSRFNITKVPTVVLFVDGRVVSRIGGAASYQRLLEFVDEHTK